MRSRWVPAVVVGALVVAGAFAQAPPPVPPAVVIDLSITPAPAGGYTLVPGDRTDKPAFVARIGVHRAVAPPGRGSVAHKRVVVFPGEPAKGSFDAPEGPVEYTIEIDPAASRAEASLRVRNGGAVLCESHTSISLAAPRTGVQPAAPAQP